MEDLPHILFIYLHRNDNITRIYQEIPKDLSTEGLNKIRNLTSDIVIDTVIPHYKNKNIYVNPSLFNFLLEPLKNANCYSKSNQPIIFNLFLSDINLVASYNDGGEYFKRKDVKECFEFKTLHPEKAITNIPGIGYNFGTKFIYDTADIIYVDNTKGTLYTGISLDKLAK